MVQFREGCPYELASCDVTVAVAGEISTASDAKVISVWPKPTGGVSFSPAKVATGWLSLWY